MEEKAELHIFKTKFGFCGIIILNKYLVASCLPQKTKHEVIRRLRKIVKKPSIVKNSKEKICNDLIMYFKGKKINFKNYKVSLRISGEFQKRVLQNVRKVKYGEITTYKKLAKISGNSNAYRAAGVALSKNKLPIIIPCHRVIKSNGNIGKYSGGYRWKKFLLQLEEK